MLRAMQQSDCVAIAELNNHYIRHTTIHFGYDEVSAAEIEGLWRKSCARYPWIVAEVDGKFAGYCKAGVWRDRAAYQWTPEAGIYVEQEFQGRGIGKALYLKLFEELTERGFHSVIGGITLPNEPSVRLHESVGFVHVGTIVRAGWKFNAWHDVGFWQKQLREAGHVAQEIG